MITKGTKIRLKAPMGGVLTDIGEIYEVVNITDEGAIIFKYNKYHMGCMSFDECEKYFDIVEEKKEPEKEKRNWSAWKIKQITIINPMTKKSELVIVRYRDDGKRVQVRTRMIPWTENCTCQLKARASCYKDDTFNLDTGLDLALARLSLKIMEKQIEAAIENM